PISLTQQKRGATVTPVVRAGLAPPSSGGVNPLDAGSPSAGSRSRRSKRLPPVMCESPIGFRHPVRVFLLLDRLALALRGEDQLGGEPLRHILLAPRPAVLDQPPHPPRGPPLGSHLAPDRLLAPAHCAASFGRLAPYLERDCFRSFTPAASSVPRMMW